MFIMEDEFTTSKAADYKQVNDDDAEKKKKKDAVKIDINQFVSTQEEEEVVSKKKKKGKKAKDTVPKEEDKKEETKEPKEEEKTEKPKSEYPLSVIFCGLCGWPVEYCEYGAKPSECSQWLKTNNEEEYNRLYTAEGKTEVKKEEGKKQKKKVAFKEQMMLIVIKKNRTPKKYITCIKGFQTFGILLIRDRFERCGKKALQEDGKRSNSEQR